MIEVVLRAVAITLILSVVLSSCTTVKIPTNVDSELTPIFDRQSKVLSDYKFAENHQGVLEDLFNPKKADSILKRENEILYIDFQLPNKNKIQITLNNQYGDTIKKEFKGNLEADIFRFKSRWFIDGNPLMWAFGTREYALGEYSSGDLILYQANAGMGFIILIPILATSSPVYSTRFEKIK
jgi:hypothetical protein